MGIGDVRRGDVVAECFCAWSEAGAVMVDPHDNKTMEINVMADGISVERLKGVMQDPANSSTRFVFNDYAQGALLSLLSLLMNDPASPLVRVATYLHGEVWAQSTIEVHADARQAFIDNYVDVSDRGSGQIG